ncbi:hypothetical protein CVT25_011587 [Psilocybe cyanescens]|uniref:Uncharacterized protein n=1 Tax=Psilocybe cyanescens TaxID=93625 RepID=A0A409XCJ0_PSICY|nr:hypothetical protein CVT25_011587 [Psilocybe cyanescens]
MSKLLEKTKLELVDDIRQEAEASVRNKIGDLVRKEVARQVKEQVAEQIKEHLPDSLQQQADESKRQLDGIKISLRNSEARIQNSFIQTNGLMDPLAPILMTTGEKSPLYPSNAWSLLNYDLESAKGLNRHYELTTTDDLQMNFKQFLKHIGTGIDIAVSEAGG